MGRVIVGGAVAAAALAGSALAQPAPPPPAQARASGVEAQTLSVTIYNQNLALVQDVRRVDLPAGRTRLELRDVSAAIRPETVNLSGRGLEVVEQNFDYDLLTPAKLMEKAVGDQVRVVRINPGDGKETIETATVLAVNDGVVLRIGDRIEVLRDDGVPTRVIFDEVPDNLRARPTLTVTLDVEGAGQREATLTYLTSGLSWKADYVAVFDEAAGRLDLQGWITLGNQSGTPFTNAEVQLVAGDVQTGQPQYPGYPPPPRRPAPVRGAGTEAGEGGEALADYYLYPLPERTTVAQNQTKQVGFVEAKGVAARKTYEYRLGGFLSRERPESVDVAIRFQNARAAGLAAQLPAGTMRVYQRDSSGDPTFVGESNIPHTPQGSDLSIKTGEAFDVTVQPTLEKQEGCGEGCNRQRVKYLVRNARAQPVTVEVQQSGVYGRWRTFDASHPVRRVDSNTLAVDVPVPAGGETTVTYTAESRRP